MRPVEESKMGSKSREEDEEEEEEGELPSASGRRGEEEGEEKEEDRSTVAARAAWFLLDTFLIDNEQEEGEGGTRKEEGRSSLSYQERGGEGPGDQVEEFFAFAAVDRRCRSPHIFFFRWRRHRNFVFSSTQPSAQQPRRPIRRSSSHGNLIAVAAGTHLSFSFDGRLELKMSFFSFETRRLHFPLFSFPLSLTC